MFLFYRLRIAILALGAVLGYGFAIHSMHHIGHRREAFERHVAEVCVDAANSVKANPQATAPAGKAAPKTEPRSDEPAAP